MGGELKRYLAVLTASVAVHAIALFSPRTAPAPRSPAAPASFEAQLEVEPPPASAPAPVAVVIPAAPPKAKPGPVVRQAAPAPPSSGGVRATDGTEEPSRGSAAEALLDDMPRAQRGGIPLLLPGQVSDSRAPRAGVTSRPDPELEAIVTKVREKARVEGRLKGFLEDGLDSARASNGMAGPEVTELGHALAFTLNHADGGTPVQLGVQDANAAYKRNYARAMAAYGASGDPGFPAPGVVPEQTERLQDLNAPMLIRAAAQARQTAQAIATAAPLFSVTFEIVQAPGGLLLSAQLLSRSGNGKFDEFVMASVPVALTRKAPVAEAPKKELHATWEIEGWLVKNDTVGHAITESLAFVGPVLDWLAVADPASAHFEYRARLLRSNR